MSKDERLQLAISKAKAGDKLSARDIFIDIIDDDPENKWAWLWLIGLLDDREDVIIACERVLAIDPTDERVRLHLDKLLRVETTEKKQREDVALVKVDRLLQEGNIELALTRLREVVKGDPDSETAWILIIENSNDLEEHERAYKRLYEINPTEKRKADLDRTRHFISNPFDLAVHYEEEGKIDKAIEIYETLAPKAQGRSEWDRLFREIDRLKEHKEEQIIHISPKATIARLIPGAPLLFLFVLIIQIGYDFRYLTLLHGIEFIMVIFGSFLAAVAAVSSEHKIWQKLQSAGGRGSKQLRMVVGAAGNTILFLPFILLGIEAYARWAILLADL